jgi:hypothetical protein
MRKFKASLAALALCIFVSAPIAHAADALIPPTLATPALPAIDNSVASLTRQTADREIVRGSWQKKWVISLAPLVASQALDSASSYGLRELNPMLAQPDGRFGMKAAGIKFGAIGGLIFVESLLVRKYPRSTKFFTVINWTTAGATTGLAIHNYTLPGR